ncbi:MAG: SPOR domain-containing protein [Spirochaetaceae bacterium]|jgi:DedD protein|nr:SPOR domain-containing protein [Spirochaetaceae bacterium]
MEKKKLLLVSVSVGLFLVIVIGASILVFSPRDYSSAVNSEVVPVSPGTPRAALAPAGTETAPAPAAAAAVTEVASATPPNVEAGQKPERTLENIIYINGDNAENAVRVERLNDGNTKTIITIPGPHENVITVNAPQPMPSDVSVQAPAPARTPVVKAEKAEVTSKPAAPASPPRASAPKTAASGGKTEKLQPKTAWWVQTNSYSKKAYADNAKKFLESKGITSVVMDGTVGGKTYYRVRVGPYLSQAEADYWLSLIKTIEGMENSLVWKSSNL